MSLTLTIRHKNEASGVVSGEGTSISLKNTAAGSFTKFDLLGDLEQNGTPTPSAPVAIQTVTGRQTITIGDGGSQSQQIELNLGKNLLDISQFEMGGMNTGNNTGGNTRINNVSKPIAVKPNTTYTLSVVIGSTVKGFRVGVHECKIDGTFVRDLGWRQLVPNAMTFKTGDTTWFVKIVGSISTTHENVVTGSTESIVGFNTVESWLRGAKLQMEVGATATSYADYFTPIELCQFGVYQDSIIEKEDGWYLHKEINRGGNFTVNGVSDYANAAYAQIAKPNDYVGKGNYLPTMLASNLVGFSLSTNLNSSELLAKISAQADSNNWWIGFPAGTTVAQAQSQLTGLEIYYPLAEAVETKITDSALLAGLNEISNAEAYDYLTTLASSGFLPIVMDVEKGLNILEKTYTEAELGAPLTISDVEGKSQNTTLNGNIYVDFAYNKKSFTVDIFNLTPSDYATIRAFYDLQFTSGNFPTVSIPELDITNMVVFLEISNRNIVNQCLLTDKLTLKFRETVQP